MPKPGRTRAFASCSKPLCARNHGWEQAQGELIQFLDADDLLSPDKIERQVARWRKHGDHYLYSAQWGRFWGDAQATQYQDQGLFQDHDPISWQVACWQNLTMMPPHVWLTPRRILERVNPWKEAILKNQDGEYFQRVIFASAGVLFCPEARCQYRSGNPNSVSAARSEASERDKFATFQLATTRLLALEDSPRTRLACASLWRGYAIQILPLHRSLAEAADALARSYGTVPMAPGKGRAFHALARLTGWRWARRLQALTGFRNR